MILAVVALVVVTILLLQLVGRSTFTSSVYFLPLIHTLFSFSVVHELLHLPPGPVPPPSELMLARAMRATHLDDLGTSSPAERDELMAGLRVWLEQTWSSSVFNQRGLGWRKWLALEAGTLALARRLRVVEAARMARIAASDVQSNDTSSTISPWTGVHVVLIAGPPLSGAAQIRRALANSCKGNTSFGPCDLLFLDTMDLDSKESKLLANLRWLWGWIRSLCLTEDERGLLTVDNLCLGSSLLFDASFPALTLFGLLPKSSHDPIPSPPISSSNILSTLLLPLICPFGRPPASPTTVILEHPHLLTILPHFIQALKEEAGENDNAPRITVIAVPPDVNRIEKLADATQRVLGFDKGFSKYCTNIQDMCEETWTRFEETIDRLEQQKGRGFKVVRVSRIVLDQVRGMGDGHGDDAIEELKRELYIH